jgi:mannobiose 2-epimerase
LVALSKVDKRDIVKERLHEVFLIFRERIMNEAGALPLTMTPDWRVSSTEVSFGHQVEIAFLVVEAAHALGIPDDPDAWRVARLMVDYALKWGWDPLNGGLFHHARTFNSRPYEDKKIWWVQAEAINSLLFMHWKFADQTDRYWTAFVKAWDFIEKHQIDPAHGGWYWETTRAGRQSGDDRKASQWKANYHTSRALINVSKLLRRLSVNSDVK